MLPVFQNDIKKIRQEFNIPQGSFKNDISYKIWYENEFIKKTDKIINSKNFLKAEKKLKILKKENYPEYLKQKWKLNDKLPLCRMNHRIKMLGKKYKLPAHFYEESYFYGLSPYITRNTIKPPANNWSIQPDPEGRKGTMKWLAIKTYSPLTKKELKDAIKMLISLQQHYFPKELIVNNRIKKQFERDLLIFNELIIKRSKKPIKRKIYSGYLSYLDPKERNQWEKFHPNDITTGFDVQTSRMVAKKFQMTPEAVRKSIQRTNTLINTFFGDECNGQ